MLLNALLCSWILFFIDSWLSSAKFIVHCNAGLNFCKTLLQRVLVALGRHEEALVVAERGRTRAFVDLLLERQTGGDGMYGAVDNAPVTIDQIMATVNKAKSTVIYYSIAAGYLYSWLLVPEKGLWKHLLFWFCHVDSFCINVGSYQTMSMHLCMHSCLSLLYSLLVLVYIRR